ncbi:MAG: VacJ family lipoprotein [Deltaproteobacteria bacterium]|jgi:phospholipid-binding lipoprotein MlaA|nr:VacJ family lipoprotein [Deltaproteobacteria bacterium]
MPHNNNLIGAPTLRIWLLCALLLCGGLALSGCASGSGSNAAAGNGVGSAFSDSGYADGSIPSLDEDDEYLEATGAHQIIADPIEPWNRFWFSFNEGAYDYVLRPLNTGYMFITPQPVRTGIGNFFHNLKAPARIINCLLQGKGMEAGVEFSCFVFNSTAGLGGIFNPAKNLKKRVEPTGNEDGGQTLGVWGMGEGMYVVWPLLGPSNVRDTLGYGVSYLTNPVNYMVDSFDISLGIWALDTFNSLDGILDAYDEMRGMSVEPYTSVRDAYTQFRRAQIAK